MEQQNQEQTRPEQVSKHMPEKKFRSGSVTATIWKKELTKEGVKLPVYTVSVQRNYKDRSGQWQSTSSFDARDLPRASLVIQEAYRFLNLNGLEVA